LIKFKSFRGYLIFKEGKNEEAPLQWGEHPISLNPKTLDLTEAVLLREWLFFVSD